MPSLSALREFKASFGDIGNEKTDLASKHIPYEDLELPDFEPEIPQVNAGENVSLDTDNAEMPFDFENAQDTADDLFGQDQSVDDVDFSAFLDTVSGGLGTDSAPDSAAPEQAGDDFNTPPDLLAGFADEMESPSPGFSDETPDLPEMETESAGSADSVPDFDAALPDLDADIFDSNSGGETDGLNLDGELPDFSENNLDLAGESPDLDGDLAAIDDGGLNLDGEPPDFGENDLDLAGESPGIDGDLAAIDDGGLNLDGELPDFGENDLDLAGESLDLGGEVSGFDENNLDSAADSFDLGGELPDFSENNLDQSGESLDLGGEVSDFSENNLDSTADSFDLGGELPDFSENNLDQSGESLDLGGEVSGFDENNLDSTADSFDLGGELPDFGEDNLDLAGESLDLGGEISDFSENNLDSTTDSFDLGGELPDFGEDNLDLTGESLDLGGEVSGFDESDLDSTAGSFDLGGELPDSGESLELEGENSSSGEIDLDAAGEVSELGAEDDFDFGSETAADESPLDSFDTFDVFNPTGTKTAEKDTDDTDFGDFSNTDFSIPGLDDDIFGDFSGTKTGGKAKSRARAHDEVEEIQLSDEELTSLTTTLAGYPLNLRIACGELIAEQAVAPDLMSKLIKLLVNGASARETAALAGKILDRSIPIPRGFEKSTGEAMEAEQSSFAYIFVHNFLPVFRLFLIIAVVAASLGYLVYKFIYTPIVAERIYETGYERIFAGEYQRANERFSEAFGMRRKKNWFYRYAEAFRDERQYIYAEQKYDELLRHYPRDKKGALDYAAMETNYLKNYDKADGLIRREILDYAPDDADGLLAVGDNSLAWGELDRSKYEDARFAYARLLDKYGWKDPVVERMMKYFIRTDNLKETLSLQAYFTENKKRKISAESLAELGGYLLDKQLEEQRGVPSEYIEQIGGIRELLIRAAEADPALPESHYHLARYYNNLGNTREERITLETAIRAFDTARQESARRLHYRIDAQRRYADTLISGREFFPAEESLVKGIGLYEDALSRRLIARNPEYGKLYASLGDLEYFTKAGNWERALDYYHRSERDGWSPPEVQYRMGSAYYQLEDWKNALEYLFAASADLPLNRRLLFALGNASYKQGDNFAAQAYFNRLLDVLETERSRLPVLLPNDRPDYIEVAERLMIARNNAGAVNEALAEQTGDLRHRSQALSLYAESSRAWDLLTRNPQTMIRSDSKPLPQLNSRNALYPNPNYEPQIFIRIDRDVLEPSVWEQLSPADRF